MSSSSGGKSRILHIHSRFPCGLAADRSVAVVRGLGGDFVHDLVTIAGDDDPSPSPFRKLASFPQVTGLATLGRLQKLAKATLGYDLVCTYDYGALNAVMAHTAFGTAFTLPPLIHHESEDAVRTGRADWYRRIALGRTAGLVVPDERIEEAALDAWQQPIGRVKDIALGIDLVPWRKPAPADLLPRLLKRPDEKWIGTVTDFSHGPLLDNLLAAFASLTDNWHLVAFGEVSNSRAFRDKAQQSGIAHRVHVPGPLAPDGRAIGLLDCAVFPDASGTAPVDAIRAMASGLPILAGLDSYAAPLLPEPSREFAIRFSDREEVGFALGTLAGDHALSEASGEANRVQARDRHDLKAMIAAHRRLYTSAIGLRQR
ncbi:glycosyltransferase [Qipengyuania oceanensis]|uniref:Glycosyltransferase n=1 Tax=Qipengyuania oceanensis TaxID=1463597 RepID=A0A844YGI2_9SPHN|nr:glycosyltransferase [Qipengyuania oceanensis]MXO63610.1 glycosyltransferase [Qipengyuania oceanensis]